MTLKFYLRVASKTLRLAYLMVTDNGFSAELDVLRFDKHEKIAGIGELPPVTMSDITAALSSSEKIVLTPLEEQE